MTATPLSTKDVKWTHEHYKGVNFKIFQGKLDRVEIVDDRTIIFHFCVEHRPTTRRGEG